MHLDEWQITFELAAIPVMLPAKISSTHLQGNELKTLLKQQDMQTIGSQWANAKKSCLLRVPSSIIPQEENIIINPLHHDFKQIKIGEPQPFNIDERLTKQPAR